MNLHLKQRILGALLFACMPALAIAEEAEPTSEEQLTGAWQLVLSSCTMGDVYTEIEIEPGEKLLTLAENGTVVATNHEEIYSGKWGFDVDGKLILVIDGSEVAYDWHLMEEDILVLRVEFTEMDDGEEHTRSMQLKLEKIDGSDA